MTCEGENEGGKNCCKKVIVKKVAAPRRLGANAIPEEILLNKSLNDAIAATLPKNYNFVTDKNAKRISKLRKKFYNCEKNQKLRKFARKIEEKIQKFSNCQYPD